MGYFIAFKVTQFQMKSTIVSQIKLGISNDAQTIITINKNELSKIDWQENDKEMVYNNKRYDVIKSKEDKTTITYYCINDKQEETLFADLNDHINSHVISTKPVKSHSSKTLENDVVKIFFNHQQLINLIPNESGISFLSIKEDIVSEYIKTNSPPPWLV